MSCRNAVLLGLRARLGCIICELPYSPLRYVPAPAASDGGTGRAEYKFTIYDCIYRYRQATCILRVDIQ